VTRPDGHRRRDRGSAGSGSLNRRRLSSSARSGLCGAGAGHEGWRPGRQSRPAGPPRLRRGGQLWGIETPVSTEAGEAHERTTPPTVAANTRNIW